MKKRALVLLFMALTLLPGAGLLVLALQDPGATYEQQLRELRAEMTRAAGEAERLLVKHVDQYHREASARFVLTDVLEDARHPALYFVDAHGSEQAPAWVRERQRWSRDELQRFDEGVRRGVRLSARGDHLPARDTFAALLGRFDAPTARAELLFRLAREELRLGHDELARRILVSIEGQRVGPGAGLPLPISIAARLLRTRDIELAPAPGDVLALQADLWKQRRRLSSALITGVLRAAPPDDPQRVEAWNRILTERGAALDPVKSGRIAVGSPAILAAGDQVWLYLFRPIPGTEVHAVHLARVVYPTTLQTSPGFTVRWRPPGSSTGTDLDTPVVLDAQVQLITTEGFNALEVGQVVAETGRIRELRRASAHAQRLRALGITMLALMVLGAGSTLVFTMRREERLLRARATLVEHVAHELRTPAATLAIHGDLLDDDHLDDATRRGYARMVQAESLRLGYIMENILDLSLEQRRTPRAVEDVDLGELVRKLVVAFRPRLREDGIDLDVEIPDMPSIRTRPHVLARILFNLLDNAVKYRRRTGPRIRLSVRTGNDRINIEVRDNGPTIPEDRREWVFQEGTRLAGEGPGSGIGLALSSKLASSLDGTLRYEPVSDDDSGGNSFVLTLPAYPRG